MADVVKDEIVLNDDELICVLTGDKKKANAKEQMLQSIILQMNEEYGFEMSDMKRDYSFSFQDEEDRKKRVVVDLAIFRAGAAKEPENLERICIVCDTKVKSSDPRKGVEGALNYALKASSCDFGLWTNGDELHFSQRVEDVVGNEKIIDLADFPGIDESIEDMQEAVKALVNAVEAATDWQGPDAENYKASLIGFAERLNNCANWMYAAGRQSIEHSEALYQRSLEAAEEISMFE